MGKDMQVSLGFIFECKQFSFSSSRLRPVALKHGHRFRSLQAIRCLYVSARPAPSEDGTAGFSGLTGFRMATQLIADDLSVFQLPVRGCRSLPNSESCWESAGNHSFSEMLSACGVRLIHSAFRPSLKEVDGDCRNSKVITNNLVLSCLQILPDNSVGK